MSSEKRENLIRQAISGDADAISALFREVRPQLTIYIQRHCPQKLARLYDTEDILQDILFDVFRRIKQFVDQGEDSLYRWMVTITRHRMLALLRGEETQKRGGKMERLSVTSESDISRLLENLSVYKRTPSRSAASHEAMLALEQAIEKLSGDHQNVIHQRYLDGKSYFEIGQSMGRSEDAAKMLCHRALRELREAMGSGSAFL